MKTSSYLTLSTLSLCIVSLIGCKTMDTVGSREVIDVLAGAGGAVLCYKTIGSGSMRVVSGAACGVGAAMLADWIQRDNKPDESNRVKNEYQRALSGNPTSPSGSIFNIRTKSNEGNVLIILTLYSYEHFPPSTQCRSFREETRVNSVVRSVEERRACRDLKGNQWTNWEIFAN